MYSVRLQQSRSHRRTWLQPNLSHSISSISQPFISRSFASLASRAGEGYGTNAVPARQEPPKMVRPELQNAAGGVLWEDPTAFAINKRSARTNLFSFPTEKQAYQFVASIGRQTRDVLGSPRTFPLNGDWAFKLFSCPTNVPEEFTSGRVDESWIKVCLCVASNAFLSLAPVQICTCISGHVLLTSAFHH